MINKEIIKNNFSRCARYYDRYSRIQNLCATRLINELDGGNFAKILDIGCGTGNYTKLLQDKFPEARIKAIDISEKMVEAAKKKLGNVGVEFIIADAETADLKEEFGLISSNASFQWFEDLRGTLLRYKRLLGKDGIISFSIFGPHTFYELNEALKELSGRDASISSCNFIKKPELAEILKGLFKKAGIHEEIYKDRYRSLSELLKIIKYTGTRGNGVNRRSFWTTDKIYNLDEIYKKRFKDITATYQVFYCKGIA